MLNRLLVAIVSGHPVVFGERVASALEGLGGDGRLSLASLIDPDPAILTARISVCLT